MSKSKKKIEHCCECMDCYLQEKKVLIFYNPIFREYYISLRSYKDGKQAIYYCPWCSCKFPASLLKKYINILLKEYNISFDEYLGKYFDASPSNEDDFFYSPKEVDAPEEFKSDKWWRKRGL